MALMRNKNHPVSGDPAEVTIPRLIDDPTFAKATELWTALRDHESRLERYKLQLQLEQHFGDRLASSDSISDRDLRKRLVGLQAEQPIAAQSAVPKAVDRPAGQSPAITRGQEIMNGAPVAPALDYSAKMLGVERQITAITEAIGAQTAVRDEIAGELTLQYSKQLKPAWDALQLELYRAAQELARTTRRVQDFRASITAAGIMARSDILAMPNVRAPLMLGDETVWDSEIATWRRILERLKIL